MRREKENAISTCQGNLIMLETFVLDKIRDVVLVEFREVTEFNKEASQIVEHSFDHTNPIVIRKPRNCHPQVVEGDVPLARGESIAGPAEDPAREVGDPTWQKAEQTEEQPC